MDQAANIERWFKNQLLLMYHNTALKSNTPNPAAHDKMQKLADELPKNKFCVSNFEVTHYLGRGSFGKFYKANWFGKQVALKALDHRDLQLNNEEPSSELKFMKEAVGQKRMLQLYGSFFERNVFLVTELTKGTIFNVKPISNRDATLLARQMVEGLAWLQSKNLVHSNINSKTILIDMKNNAKFGDFGNMFRLPQGKDIVKKPNHIGTISMSHAASIENKMYGLRTDVFGVGLVIFEAITGKPLLQANFEIPEENEQKFYSDCFKLGRVKEKWVDGELCAVMKNGSYVREHLERRIFRKIPDKNLQNLITMLTSPGGCVEEIPLATTALKSEILRKSLSSFGVSKIFDNDGLITTNNKTNPPVSTNEIKFFRQPSLTDGATLATRIYFDASVRLKTEAEHHKKQTLSHVSASQSTIESTPPDTVRTLYKKTSRQKKSSGRKRDSANFTCDDCGEQFGFQSNLFRHKKKHKLDAKSFKCDVCNKQFSRSDNLKKHYLTHKDEKPFACTKCSYQGKYKHVFENHQIRKHNVKPR